MRLGAHAARKNAKDALQPLPLLRVGEGQKFGDIVRTLAPEHALEILAQTQAVVYYVVFPEDFVAALGEDAVSFLAPFQAQLFRAQAAVSGPSHPDHQRHQRQRARTQTHGQHERRVVHKGELAHGLVARRQRKYAPAVAHAQLRPGGQHRTPAGVHEPSAALALQQGFPRIFTHVQRGKEVLPHERFQKAVRRGGDNVTPRVEQADRAIGDQLRAQRFRVKAAYQRAAIARTRCQKDAGRAIALSVAEQGFALQRRRRAGKVRQRHRRAIVAHAGTVFVHIAEPGKAQRFLRRVQARGQFFRVRIGVERARRAFQRPQLLLQKQRDLRAAAAHPRFQIVEYPRLHVRARRPVVSHDGEDDHDHDHRQQQRHQRVHAHFAHRARHCAATSSRVSFPYLYYSASGRA